MHPDADTFFKRIKERLDAGGIEYENRSFSKPLETLLVEIEEEIVDTAAWSFIAWTRLRAIMRKLPEEPRRVGSGAAQSDEVYDVQHIRQAARRHTAV